MKKQFSIMGAIPSKSNSYKITVRPGAKFPTMYKGAKLKEYEQKFFLQVPADSRNVEMKGLLRATLHCYYTSNRLDLDNSAKIILDCLQTSKVIKNDRDIVELIMTKHIDKENPRVEMTIEELI